MTNNYSSSRSDLLKRIGLSPSKKLLIFLISAALVTIPLGHVYNSIAIIMFVLYSLLSAKKEDISINYVLLLPVFLFALMSLSLFWSVDFKSTLMALSKEASLIFIPFAFCFNKQLIRMGTKQVLKNYSNCMFLFGIYFIGRAAMQYSETKDLGVFIYTELATPSLTSVYLSALFSVSYFYYLSFKRKRAAQYAGLIFMALLVALLMNKSIMVINIVLTAIYLIFYSSMQKTIRTTIGIGVLAVTAALVYYVKNTAVFPAEYISNVPETQALAKEGLPINNVTLSEAWSKPRFDDNDYFNGTAFRVYQVRIFIELLSEDNIFFTGYGLNASLAKIEEKSIEHNVFEGGMLNHRYSRQNFHNQYVETFADLGIFGFLLLLCLLSVNLKNALSGKDFMHIAFAVLMIALLLTESFLWRQRGVVLFTILYCLFTIRVPKSTEKQQHEKNTHNRGGGFFRVTPV